ncbi:hypothetical protein BT93_G1109 [Corymbia citriodora subsp. variegata]|nr:hypothetical protein BT93_G1109 [Corymbia citriodora subsp. variegata]
MDSSIKLSAVFIMILFFPQASFGDLRTEVQIVNNLPGGPLLTVHCKSKDDDLGIHGISSGNQWGFSFKPNIWGTTLFFCSFQWPGSFYHFDIYDDKRDGSQCSTCVWNIKPTGPCLGDKLCDIWNP